MQKTEDNNELKKEELMKAKKGANLMIKILAIVLCYAGIECCGK